MVKQCIEAVEQFDESHLTQITTEVNQVLGKNKPQVLILPDCNWFIYLFFIWKMKLPNGLCQVLDSWLKGLSAMDGYAKV